VVAIPHDLAVRAAGQVEIAHERVARIVDVSTVRFA